MQQWATGEISDDKLLSELDKFVFKDPNKGQSLLAFLLIAQGEREQGVKELRSYIEAMKLSIEREKADTRIVNLKKQENIRVAEKVFQAVQLDKQLYFQNTSLQHGHKHRVRQIQFSANNKYMTTISSDACKLWRVGANLIGEVIMIPFEGESKEEKEDDHFHCCASSSGNFVIVMRGSFFLDIYKVDAEGERFERKEKINLKREILANNNPGFEFDWLKDTVHDVRFLDVEDQYILVSFTKDT
jgi:hypothetical protein